MRHFCRSPRISSERDSRKLPTGQLVLSLTTLFPLVVVQLRCEEFRSRPPAWLAVCPVGSRPRDALQVRCAPLVPSLWRVPPLQPEQTIGQPRLLPREGFRRHLARPACAVSSAVVFAAGSKTFSQARQSTTR